MSAFVKCTAASFGVPASSWHIARSNSHVACSDKEPGIVMKSLVEATASPRVRVAAPESALRIRSTRILGMALSRQSVAAET